MATMIRYGFSMANMSKKAFQRNADCTLASSNPLGQRRK
jgi:hypothetical protein